MANQSLHLALSSPLPAADFNRKEMRDSSLHSELMSVYLNYDQFQNSVWQVSYGSNVTIPFETLVRQSFDMFSRLSIDLLQRNRLAADFVVGLLQAAGHPLSALTQEDVAERNSQKMQVEERVEENLTSSATEVKKEEEEVCLTDSYLDHDDHGVEGMISPEDRHNPVFTKNVPREVVYAIRGVRCRVCGDFVRGPKCLEELIRHTKVFHPLKATPKHLRMIRLDKCQKCAW